MTSVYNFFALPPARAGFCTAALDLSNRYTATSTIDPVGFASVNFASLEAPFDNFFADYERYQRDSAQWDAKYGDEYGPSQPGWVAVQEARRNGIPVPSAEDNPASTLAEPNPLTSAVTDQATGADVPVIPVQENVISQPVTQPIPSSSSSDGSR